MTLIRPWWPLWWGVIVSAAVHATAVASPYRDASSEVGVAVSVPGQIGEVIEGCLLAASSSYRVPPAVLVILLNVEGGRLGRVSSNANGTVDIGPMQVNEIWLQDLARHWHASVSESFLALRDSFCANVEAGAFILRQGLDEAHGDFWTGVGYYHSHDAGYKAEYLRKVLAQALRYEASRVSADVPPFARSLSPQGVQVRPRAGQLGG